MQAGGGGCHRASHARPAGRGGGGVRIKGEPTAPQRLNNTVSRLSYGLQSPLLWQAGGMYEVVVRLSSPLGLVARLGGVLQAAGGLSSTTGYVGLDVGTIGVGCARWD